MNILLTTDYTEASENAIKYALELFEDEQDVHYTVLHAYKNMIPYAESAPAITVIQDQELKDELQNKLIDVQEWIVDQDKHAISRFEEGTLRKAVEKVVEEEDIDLIIMGSREKSAMERMTLGSNVLDVSSNIQCPILTVPKEARYDKLDKIVFAADLEPLNVNYQSLKMLKTLAEKADSKLDVLHVFKDKDKKENLKEEIEDTALHRYLNDVEHTHCPVVNDSVSDGIKEYIDESKPSLLTLIPRSRNFIEKIFHNTLTEKMVYHTQVPMLLME